MLAASHNKPTPYHSRTGNPIRNHYTSERRPCQTLF
nr:MAG TPA: hypothetical protein [Caudoviricetes sp.]